MSKEKKRKLDYKEMSDRECSVQNCKKRIKQNVVNRQPEADLCHEHYLIASGKRGRAKTLYTKKRVEVKDVDANKKH
jgi:hypothetical protein